MNRKYVWDTEIEMLTFAHLTNTNVFSYDTEYDRYTVYSSCHVDLSLEKDLTTRSYSMSSIIYSVHGMYIGAPCIL